MARTGPVVVLDRRERHHQILKQLSVSCLQDVFDEAENADRSLLLEAVHVYSNERCLILRGLVGDESKQIRSANNEAKVERKRPPSQRYCSIPPSLCQLKSPQFLSEVSYSKRKKDDLDFEELKSSILELLLLPKSAADAGIDDSEMGLESGSIYKPFICDNKVGCPYHRPVPEGEALKSSNGNRASNGTDIVSIGKMLKLLKFAEKRRIAAWLISSVKQLVEETENFYQGWLNRTLASVDEKSTSSWKLGEDELPVIPYLIDVY